MAAINLGQLAAVFIKASGKTSLLTEFAFTKSMDELVADLTDDQPDPFVIELEWEGNIIPITLQWRRKWAEEIWELYLSVGTILYGVYVASLLSTIQNNTILIWKAEKKGRFAEAKRLELETRDIAKLAEQQAEVAERFAETAVFAGDDAEAFRLTSEALQKQADDYRNWENLTDAQKAKYVDDLEAIKKANIKTVAQYADEAADAKKAATGALRKVLFAGLDIGVLAGTLILDFVLTQEQEQMILDDIDSALEATGLFEPDFTGRYGISFPTDLSSVLFQVGIIYIGKMFADVAELALGEIAIDSVLSSAFGLLSYFFSFKIENPVIVLPQGGDVDINGLLPDLMFKEIREDPYLLLEFAIGAFAIKAIWKTYGSWALAKMNPSTVA